jgi:hypothetical protein
VPSAKGIASINMLSFFLQLAISTAITTFAARNNDLKEI